MVRENMREKLVEETVCVSTCVCVRVRVHVSVAGCVCVLCVRVYLHTPYNLDYVF